MPVAPANHLLVEFGGVVGAVTAWQYRRYLFESLARVVGSEGTPTLLWEAGRSVDGDVIDLPVDRWRDAADAVDSSRLRMNPSTTIRRSATATPATHLDCARSIPQLARLATTVSDQVGSMRDLACSCRIWVYTW